MTIYKYLKDYYIAQVVVKGRIFHGFGKNHLEALMMCVNSVYKTNIIL